MKCLARIPNVRQRIVGPPDKMSGEAQRNFAYSAIVTEKNIDMFLRIWSVLVKRISPKSMAKFKRPFLYGFQCDSFLPHCDNFSSSGDLFALYRGTYLQMPSYSAVNSKKKSFF